MSSMLHSRTGSSDDAIELAGVVLVFCELFYCGCDMYNKAQCNW